MLECHSHTGLWLLSRCLVGKFDGPNKGLQVPKTILSIFFVDLLHEILFKEWVLWLKSLKIIDLVSPLLLNIRKMEIWYNKKILRIGFCFFVCLFVLHNLPVLEIKSSDCYPVLFQLRKCYTVIKHLIFLSSSWIAWDYWMWKPVKILGLLNGAIQGVWIYRQHYA